MLATYAEAPLTRSELENRFLAIIRGRGIPEPSCNVIVDGFCVDYCWPGQRLVVELDSLEFHRSRSRFEADRRQDRAHRAAGTEILRFTDHDLRSNAAGTGEELLQALNRACAAASGP
jgi:very-short-patch-repair endonuclease